jgi:excisionase family DNA binding protein
MLRRNRGAVNGEPRWLTDYRNNFALNLAFRLRRGLCQQFEPQEQERAHGRVVYVDPLLQSDAYMVLSQERIHLALVNTRQAWKPVQTLVPVQYMFVNRYLADGDGRWVKLTTRGYLPRIVPEPANPDDEADMAIQAGEHGRDLIAALLDLIDGAISSTRRSSHEQTLVITANGRGSRASEDTSGVLTEIGRLFPAELRQLREQERPHDAKQRLASSRRRTRLTSIGSAPGDDDLLSSGDVAVLLNVAPKTVSHWAANGVLPSIRTPGGHRRYRWADVRAWIG